VAAAADLGRASAVERVAPDPGTDAACLLYERHADTVFRFCLSRLRSREEAEDARQTTFLYAFRALRRGVVPISGSSWLLKIAENVCLTRSQDAKRRLAVEVTQDPQTLGQVAAPAKPDVELLMPLGEALGRLTDSQRQALLLREWRGLSYREVAARLGIGQGAVEVLLFRARRALAEELEAPGRTRRRRVPLDFGSLASVAKQFLGGATTITSKSALTAVAVATAAAVSTVAVSLGPKGTRAAAPAVRVGTPPPRTELPGVAQLRPARAATVRVLRAEKPQARTRPAEGPTTSKVAPPEAPPSAPAQAPRPSAEPTEATPLPVSKPPSQVVEEPLAVPNVIDDVATPLAPVVETATDVLGDLVDTGEIAETTASTVTAGLPAPALPEPALPPAPGLP
jgi:RNA polymerase sigma factor (sigma-70 family)